MIWHTLPAVRVQFPAPSQPLQRASPQAGASVPARRGEQIPTDPGMLQAWQGAVQISLQQRPCAQLPEAHSTGRLHSAPVGRLPHVPSRQKKPGAHWLSFPHWVMHRVPVQPRNGAQVTAAGVRQVPAMQTEAAVWALGPASQRGARQVAPFG
jgi:hypothetical protein